MKKLIINSKLLILMLLIAAALSAVFLRNAAEFSRSYFMMDTYVEISASGFGSRAAVKNAHARLAEIEKKMNAYSDKSLISSKTIDDDIEYVLKKGVEYGKISNGLFDVTIKPLADLWSIGSDKPRVPKQSEIDEAIKRVDYKKIDFSGGTVNIPDSTELDFGGIAKGFAADEAARILHESGVSDALVNLGGNVYAIGRKKIGVQNPLSDNGDYLGIVTVTDKTVVTSGGYERYFVNNGKKYHHILNPKTGYPCETDLISATVIGLSSVDADPTATILFMLGKDRAKKFATQHGLSVILVSTDCGVYASEDVDFIITNEKFKSEE